MNYSWTSLVLLASLLVASSAANAEIVRQHGPHTHGHGQLDLVLENELLLATLIVPGMDLVGFEHPAQSEAETATLQRAVDVLGNAEGILGLPAAAQCRTESVDIDSSVLPGDHTNDPDDDEAQGDDDHHDHDHEEGHAEFHISYQLMCAHPEKLDHLTPGYFAAFKRTQELAVQAVGPWGQTSRVLTRENPQLAF